MGILVDAVDSETTDMEVNMIEDIRDSNPLVYQLVRVEGDGRFLPATDDELMEAEQLLADNESKHIWHDGSDFSQENVFLEKFHSEGPLHTESNGDSGKLNHRLEEERLHLPARSFSHSSRYTTTNVQTYNLFNDKEARYNNLQPDYIPREAAPSCILLNVSQNTQAGNAQICSEIATEAVTGKLPVSETCSGLEADLCILKREISLDDLPIKNLQEIFRSIFGRQTNVKDKLWLKRRITMGLTNSTDVSSTNIVIRGDKIADKKVRGETSSTTGVSRSKDVFLSLNQLNDPKNISSQDIQVDLSDQIVNQKVSCKRLKGPNIEHEMKDRYYEVEHHSPKRMRKATRRYIEELSELETRDCNVKVHSSKNTSRHDESSRTFQARSFCLIDTQGKSFSTRYDSVGGFGMLVPYVCRIRRSRPRKDLVTLMRFVNSEKVNLDSLKSSKEKQNVKVGDDCGVIAYHTQPRIEGGAKRKHHRAWTMSEVLRLVEGVSRCGAGRWSEIRQQSFVSYPYRTSVDLKDKWRNLVRASFLQCSIQKGVNKFQNHTSIPVSVSPAILCRVRKLAELHQQTGIVLRPKKPSRNEEKSEQENVSGFL